jgi:hypothetical protein
VNPIRWIAAKTVDAEPDDLRAIPGIHHRVMRDQRRDHSAAVNVSRQQHRHVGGARKAHIGDVAGAQICLSRAAGPFDDHDVMGGGQARETAQHLWQQ